ncbi:TetR/AcrR family transcriptional regulator [Iamia sp. SCSIO 61187]|uniref:TetR/AcrR family transcriptional regulator n=1 Tax=Iamia sp. SCSIO 61187 TaxID=2722752 RepID=UPI001C626BB0|nr:TetR/AcrR family transcriptional regulator [Iamia sp. SCSIO 61187]QYG94501.1 TetR/AcrR family transcriptional regulator [Iamia sp. SCSIO 61187]
MTPAVAAHDEDEPPGVTMAGLPDRPSVALDPLLDAAAACFVRHGIARTRVPDIAAEMGVSRVTVYRQAGGIEQILGLLIARDLQRLLDMIPSIDGKEDGPALVVRILSGLVSEARSHPVLQKVLRDEPAVIGPLLATELPEIIDRAGAVLSPVLDLLASEGQIAHRDGRVLSGWLVRIGISLILAPVEDAESFLAEILRPALEKSPGSA